MNTSTLEVRSLLILLFFSFMPFLEALYAQTEYPGIIVHEGQADDRRWGSFPIGFDFDFYGNIYNEFFVSSNGLVLFGAGSNAFSNLGIPDDGRPDNYIAAFWDDLIIHSSGDIMYQTIGIAPNRKLIIQFSNMSFWTSTVLLGTIQVILYEGSNNIRIQYNNIIDLSSDRASGNSATIGLENIDGTVGVECSYNTAGYVYSGRSILFTPNGGSYTYDDNALYENVLLVNDIPRAGIPKLISPAHGSTVGESVIFQWEASTYASSYYLVISQNADLSTPIHTSADLTGLSYEYIMAPDQTYYWSIAAKNSVGDPTWSEIWTFQTSATPPFLAVPRSVNVEQGVQQLLYLQFTGGDTLSKTATIVSLPVEGSLYQNDNGVPGAEITSVPTDVSDAFHGVIYSASGATGNGAGSFDFHFTDGNGTSTTASYTINVLPLGAPNFLSASKETNRVEITFDRPMADPTGSHLEFTVEDNGVPVTSSSCALKTGDPSTIVVYITPNLNTANPITVAYTRGSVTAANGGILESFDFQLAGKLAQTISFNALPDRTYGDADFTLSATASSALPVSFSSSNSTVVSVSGTNATIHNAGQLNITAYQAGDDTYASVSFERPQLVNKAIATVILSNLSQSYTGSGLQATATTAPAGLDVHISYNGSTALPVDLGSYAVVADIVETNYTGSAGATLTITDNEGPVPDIPVLPVLSDECSVTPVPPTATDLYAGQVTGTTGTPFPITTQGTTIITWTYDDGNGNTSSQTQNVVIDDVSDPVTPVLADQALECSDTASAPTTTDNCVETITGTTTDPLSYFSIGIYVINWTFDDGNGNSIVVPQNVIVSDLTDPEIPTLPDLNGECSVTAVAPTTMDACAGILTGTTTDPLSYSSQGIYVINWNFDDGNGNSIVVPQNVIVDDVTDPVIPVLPDVIGECSATATVPSTTDACTGTITGTTSDPLNYSSQGTHVIQWNFDDGNGNSIVVPQNVIVDDVTDPVIPILPDVSGECSVTATAPTTTDACAGTITGTTTDTLSYYTAGIHVITWTFDDGNGNSIQVPQNIIVLDDIEPVTPTLPDLSDECSVEAVTPTTTDNCVGTISGTTNDPVSYWIPGDYVINWTFDDGNGNVVYATQNVSVTDITAPTATVPADAFTCDGRVSSIGLTDISDNCSTSPAVSYELSGATTGNGSGDASSEIFAPGVTTVTYTVNDGHGNSSQYQLTVTYQPVENIVVTIADGTLTCETSGTYQWINCSDNSIIAGETGNTFRPGVNGEYAVILAQGQCSDTSDCYTMDYTGIADSRYQDYKVYPNPAREKVSIQMAQEHTNVSIKIFDVTGNLIKMMEQDRFTETDINISDFKAGLYMIHIHSDQLNSVARIIKE